MRCIPAEEGRQLINDIHSGECGHHSSSRTIAGKVFRSGFYWPTVLQDAAAIVQSCDACQFHAKQIHQPVQGLQTIPLSWPFAVWGLDLLGPFPRALGGYRYLYVAIDKFTKWPEVEPVRTIPAKSAVKFISLKILGPCPSKVQVGLGFGKMQNRSRKDISAHSSGCSLCNMHILHNNLNSSITCMVLQKLLENDKILAILGFSCNRRTESVFG